MKGTIDFIFGNVKEGQEVQIVGLTLDNKPIINYDFSEWETPIMFVCHLDKLYNYFGSFLESKGYKMKKANKEFYARVDCLKNNEFCFINNKSAALKVNDKLIKIYDTSAWLDTAKDPWEKLTSDEIKLFNNLSSKENLKSTPIQNVIPFNFFGNEVFFDENMQRDIEAGIIGGIIIGEPAFYKTAYHYDITSLYPFIFSTTAQIPSTTTATYLERDEICDHDKYAYWILDEDRLYHCNLAAKIAPAGSIKMKLKQTPLKYKEKILELYNNKSKEIRGTPEYIIAKRSCNALVGKMAQHKLNSSFRKMPAAYSYIIARCRQHMMGLLERAMNEGANVLQINTDGFFTDLPISFYDSERFLGSLRYEYKATNLYIYASNQYSCDQEVCIAGLPKKVFVNGQRTYNIFTVVKKHDKYYYSYRHFTLGGIYE